MHYFDKFVKYGQKATQKNIPKYFRYLVLGKFWISSSLTPHTEMRNRYIFEVEELNSECIHTAWSPFQIK